MKYTSMQYFNLGHIVFDPVTTGKRIQKRREELGYHSREQVAYRVRETERERDQPAHLPIPEHPCSAKRTYAIAYVLFLPFFAKLHTEIVRFNQYRDYSIAKYLFICISPVDFQIAGYSVSH